MIKPENIVSEKKKHIPAEVEKAVDFLIGQKWNGKSATFKQDELIQKIVEFSGIDFPSAESKQNYRNRLFETHALDFEDVYRAAGWSVVYDKPAYNESYSAFFKFEKGKPSAENVIARLEALEAKIS